MSEDRDFEALSALLPFFISGTLSDADRARVEEGLRDFPQLQKELERELVLFQNIQSAGDAIMAGDDNQEDRLEALLSKLPDQPKATPDTPQNRETRPANGALAFLSPKFWVPALVMSLVIAIGAQASVISQKSNQIAELEAKFQSSGGPCKDDQQGVSRIIVEFKEDANWQAIAGLLDAQQLRIVNSEGFGTLTLASQKTSNDLQVQVETLKASPLVLAADVAR